MALSTTAITGAALTGAGASAAPTTAASTAPGGALGKNAFLQLLVAQLKYQNPMQPVSNTQFVTQLAQFQMLSDLTAIRSDLNALVAAGKASAGTTTAGGGTPSGASSGTASGASTSPAAATSTGTAVP